MGVSYSPRDSIVRVEHAVEFARNRRALRRPGNARAPGGRSVAGTRGARRAPAARIPAFRISQPTLARPAGSQVAGIVRAAARGE